MGQVEDLYPATSLQQGLLFHNLRETDDATYVSQWRADIDALDVPRFREAWHAVVARHEALRTGFLYELDTPLQWVAKTVALPFSEVDLRDRPDQLSATR